MDSASGQEGREDSCKKGEQFHIGKQTRTFNFHEFCSFAQESLSCTDTIVLMDSIHWIPVTFVEPFSLQHSLLAP